MQRWISQLLPEQRIIASARKFEASVARLNEVIHLQEANRIIVYSKALSSQVPLSHAGGAFRAFTQTMFKGQLSNLVALFDERREDRNSLRTVVELIHYNNNNKALIMKNLRGHSFPSRTVTRSS